MTSVSLDEARAAAILGWMADHLRRFPKEFEATKIVSLNRVGSRVNTRAIRLLTERYAAKRAEIVRKIKVTKASSAQPFFHIRGEGRPIHLGRWPQKSVKIFSLGRRRRLSGLRVNILKGSGFNLVPGGFGGVSSKNNQDLVFKRETEKRLPIKALYGPSIIGRLTKDENLEPLLELGRTSLTVELQRQAQFRLRKLGLL